MKMKLRRLFIGRGSQFVAASMLLSFLCREDVADYRRKLESIVEATAVPTLRLRLPVLVFSRKPSDQWSVGCPPQRILPEKKKGIMITKKKNKKQKCCPAKASTQFVSSERIIKSSK